MDVVLRARVEHGHEVRMGDPGGRQRLTPEPLDERAVVRQPAPQDLHGDLPVQDPVGRQIDLGHPAAAEELADRVAVGEHRSLHAHPLRLRETSISRL
jgi:hypothetical protein